MVWPELGLHPSQRLLEDRQGVVQPAGVQVGHAEVVQGDERVGVIRAELGLHQPVHLFEKWQGIDRTARGLVRPGEVVHGGEGVGVIGPEPGLAASEPFLEERDRLG